MNGQKIFFGGNVKFLRERRKLSQESLAETLGLSRSKLSALENGHTKAPQPEDYLTLSEYFKISVDNLLKVDLSRLGELPLRELEAGNDLYVRGGNLRVLAITTDADNRENVEYVPVKAKAGYRDGYADPEFIASLPKLSLPDLPEGHTFRMFPISGDSMLPVPDGSTVVGQYVEDWTGLKSDTPCVLVLRGDSDFVFKLVTVLHDHRLLLRSLNTLYESYTVEGGDVLEVWKFYSFQSREIPATETTMDQLLKMVLVLQREVKEMRGSAAQPALR